MRKPTSSSKCVIAALVAATFGLTAGPAMAQTPSQGDQSNSAASHKPASKKSVRELTSQVKQQNEHAADDGQAEPRDRSAQRDHPSHEGDAGERETRRERRAQRQEGNAP